MVAQKHHTSIPAASSEQKRLRLIGKEGPGIIKELADAITAKYHFARTGSVLFVFIDGVYAPKGEETVEACVKRILEQTGQTAEWSSHKANEVAEYIRVDAPELWNRPPDDVLNLNNGLLNVRTRKLDRHSPEFLSPVRIPVTFDQKADCPQWKKFIATTFPDDTQELAWELAAWLMTPNTSIQKAVLLLGEGSNGKSTWLTALTAFLGKKNVTSKSLHKLEMDKFAKASLLGKLANICPDLPSGHLAETSTFKALTGTEAQLDAEIKYKDSFEFEPFARLIFAANQPPRSNDATHAFFRRWLVVPFDRTFEEGTDSVPIPRDVLDALLAEPKELSGVLNMALAVYPRVREKGITETPSMKAAWNEFRQTTDPLSVWLDQNTIAQPEAIVIKHDLLKAYNDYLIRVGSPPVAESAFGRAFSRARPNIADCQRTIDGNRVRCWQGIGMKSEE